MTVFEEYDEALKKLRLKLPELLKEKHKDATPEMMEFLLALTAVAFQYLPLAMGQGGAAGVSALRLAFELTKVLD